MAKGRWQAVKVWLRRPVVRLMQYQEEHAADPPQYVLILGHMRSGSTLLSHILMSHAELLGCGERNAPYASPYDLALLRFHARYQRRQFFTPYRYFVDQINHNKFIPEADFLNHPRIMKIFLLRQPAAAVTSMVKVLGKFYDTSLEQSVGYYTERLAGLEQYALALKDARRAFFLSYEELVQDTEARLADLQKFLYLSTPLSASYTTYEFTGKRGDPGPNIGQGRVTQAGSPESLELPPAEEGEIQGAYDRCRATLEACCVKEGRL